MARLNRWHRGGERDIALRGQEILNLAMLGFKSRTGYWTLDFDTGYWMLDTRHWTVGAGCALLVVGVFTNYLQHVRQVAASHLGNHSSSGIP